MTWLTKCRSHESASKLTCELILFILYLTCKNTCLGFGNEEFFHIYLKLCNFMYSFSNNSWFFLLLQFEIAIRHIAGGLWKLGGIPCVCAGPCSAATHYCSSWHCSPWCKWRSTCPNPIWWHLPTTGMQFSYIEPHTIVVDLRCSSLFCSGTHDNWCLTIWREAYRISRYLYISEKILIGNLKSNDW